MTTDGQRALAGATRHPRTVAGARSFADRVATIPALVALLGAHGLLRLIGFGRFCSLVRRWPRKPGSRYAGSQRLADAMTRAAILHHRHAWCLERSAATACLLRLAGHPAEMVIGVHRMPFRAHAWVELEGDVINDLETVKTTYTELDRC